MTVGQAIHWAQEQLACVSGEDATADARLFVCAAAGITPDRILMKLDAPLQGRQEAALRDMVRRRKRQEPAQYIVGTVQFLGLELKCDPRSLIPRFETEMLALESLRVARIQGLSTALDICTGCGCLGIYLALSGLTVAASDFSEDALMLAEENARLHGVALDFYQGDLFGAVPEDATYDIIVSNPPYVRSGDIPLLQPEVRSHEPHLALDAGEDGLLFYRRIASDGPSYMKPGGWILLEMGEGQEEAVTKLFSDDFQDIEILPDMRGIGRIFRAKRKV